MAKITQNPKVDLTVTFTITESEARALDALVGYDFDSFVNVFYEKMGKHYMKPHEDGLREFFKSVRDFMPPILHRTNDAREVFNGTKVAKRKEETE